MNYTEIPMEDWFDKHLKEAYYESKTYDENAEEDDDDFEKELDLEIIITELQLIQDLQEVPEDKYAIHGEIEDIVLLLQDFDDKYQLEEQTETIIAKLRDIEDAHDLDKKVEDVIAQLHLLETPDDGADKNNAHFNTDLNPKMA